MSDDFADAGEGGCQIIRTSLHFAQLEQEMMAAIAKNRMIWLPVPQLATAQKPAA
jgi:hypothetical protein